MSVLCARGDAEHEGRTWRRGALGDCNGSRADALAVGGAATTAAGRAPAVAHGLGVCDVTASLSPPASGSGSI